MDDVDMVAEQIADLTQRAAVSAPTARVELLAEAVSLAYEPLRRVELTLLLVDAAGRAAHEAAGHAQAGQGMPGGTAATWEQIAAAAGIARDAAWRQWHHGAALSWPSWARGVRQTPPKDKGATA